MRAHGGGVPLPSPAHTPEGRVMDSPRLSRRLLRSVLPALALALATAG
ncbi:hypothetical protein GTV15_03620, partial [Streptomyces sp. SID7803]|nr:hypothetical protein [Streptomyces sp. SID7803]